MNTPQLGKLIEGPVGRDAVHVAIAPVVAGERLRPGSHVGLVMGEALGDSPDGAAIGVVDPFLPDFVQPGQRFWLFLYPNTVTSLRHIWTHPAFKTRIPETT